MFCLLRRSKYPRASRLEFLQAIPLCEAVCSTLKNGDLEHGTASHQTIHYNESSKANVEYGVVLSCSGGVYKSTLRISDFYNHLHSSQQIEISCIV